MSSKNRTAQSRSTFYTSHQTSIKGWAHLGQILIPHHTRHQEKVDDHGTAVYTEPNLFSALWCDAQPRQEVPQNFYLLYFLILPQNFFVRTISHFPESFTRIGPAILESTKHRPWDLPPPGPWNVYRSLRLWSDNGVKDMKRALAARVAIYFCLERLQKIVAQGEYPFRAPWNEFCPGWYRKVLHHHHRQWQLKWPMRGQAWWDNQIRGLLGLHHVCIFAYTVEKKEPMDGTTPRRRVQIKYFYLRRSLQV